MRNFAARNLRERIKLAQRFQFIARKIPAAPAMDSWAEKCPRCRGRADFAFCETAPRLVALRFQNSIRSAAQFYRRAPGAGCVREFARGKGFCSNG